MYYLQHINTPPTSGGSYNMTGLTVGGSSSISYSVTTLNGSYNAFVYDSNNVLLAGQAIQGTGNYTLSFVSPSTTAQFQLISSLPPGILTISGISYQTLYYVAGTTTKTVCNTVNDFYRFGFNGKEKDNEWAGVGNSLDYGARMEDTRIARFRSNDPLFKKYPELTPYQFASNTPIRAIDLDGLESAAPPNMNFMWTQAGITGNDWNTAKPILKEGAKQFWKDAKPFILAIALYGVGEVVDAIVIGADVAEETAVISDAATVERPFYEPTEVPKTTGTTQVQKPTATQVEEGTSNASTAKQVSKSKVQKSVKTEEVGGGKFIKKTKISPGKGPGQSRAEMEMTKNADGKLIRTRKFSYDRANKFQGKKPLRGGPEGRKPDGSMPQKNQ